MLQNRFVAILLHADIKPTKDAPPREQNNKTSNKKSEKTLPNCAKTLIDYNSTNFPSVVRVYLSSTNATARRTRFFPRFLFNLEQSSLMNSPKKDGDDVPIKDPVKYGELVILG